jgi:hypothetical protein
MTNTTLPDRGVVFWPVGTGDSTTIVIDDEIVMQVDLRDMDAADDDDSVVAPVIDGLAETLPTMNGKPYLATFALTHADLDHCSGFGDLLDSDILIGEIWATPRLWREVDDGEELCPDAERFHQEAKRRVAATLKAVEQGREPGSGDRIRIIGHDKERTDHPYADLPRRFFSYPGELITTIDGRDVNDRFEAFVHAPFREDCAAERNETSLSLQIALKADDGTLGRLLLFGDLSYVTLKKIFDYSEAHGRDERVAWDIMLSAHHCSRKVMYAPDDTGKEELKQDLLDQFERHAGENAYVIASSSPFRDADKPGDNPPHRDARDRYEEIVDNPLICTGEYPDADAPRPVVFGLESGEGFLLLETEDLPEAEAASGLAMSARMLAALGATTFAAGWAARRSQRRGTEAVREAIKRERGTEAAPATTVGFGWR